ncbi:MAG: hypothetical protein JWL73_1765 [Actinomycetia bacterium]|nr:hypothetical protein [Actinomycetes bacterium]
MEPRESVVAPLALAGLSAVTAVSLTRVLTGTSFLPPALAAALLPHAVGVLSRRLRLPVAANALLSILSLVLVGVWTIGHRTLAYGLPTASTFGRIRPDLQSGWALFRSAVAPVRPGDGALLLAVVALWATAQIADELAFRMHRALAAAIPSLALFTIIATIGTTKSRVILTVAFATAAITYLFLVNREGLLQRGDQTTGATRFDGTAAPAATGLRARAGRRDLRAGAVIGVLAIGIGTVAGAFVPGASGSALVRYNGLGGHGGRRGDITVTNPTVGFGSKLREPTPSVVFTVVSKQPLYWRLAGLDQFNGNQWTFNEPQAPASSGLPRPTRGATVVHQEFTATGLQGFLVPAAFTPVKTSLGGAVVAPRTLTIVAANTLSGSTFTVDSQVPRTPTRADKAATAIRTSNSLIRKNLELPADFPTSVRRLAEKLTAPASNDWEKAQALETYFTGGSFTYDLSPDLTDSSSAIVTFLRDKRGFCQQFAAAFAAMARSVGIPARVAVGYTYGTSLGHDTYQVTNQQLHAWPEVWLNGLGWTMFEPTPKGDAPGQTPNYPGAGNAVTEPTAPATTAATNDTVAPVTTAGTPPTLGAPAGKDSTPAWVWAVAAIPVIVAVGAVAFAIAIGAAKRRRERRRRAAPDPRTAVVGAWAEAVDRLAESGRVVRPDLTPLELAGDASAVEPEQLSAPLLLLARSYTRASCSPRAPGPERVVQAWAAVDELGRYLDGSVGPATRWRRRFDPRTVWRRRT